MKNRPPPTKATINNGITIFRARDIHPSGFALLTSFLVIEPALTSEDLPPLTMPFPDLLTDLAPASTPCRTLRDVLRTARLAERRCVLTALLVVVAKRRVARTDDLSEERALERAFEPTLRALRLIRPNIPTSIIP